MIEHNIAYVMVFFWNFLKCLCSKFVKFKEKKNRLPGARAPFEVFDLRTCFNTSKYSDLLGL
jgi:hypothetical protein